MENLIAKSSSIVQQSNLNNIKNIPFEPIDSSSSNIEVAKNQALENQGSQMFSLPSELIEYILKMLMPKDWFSFLLTCKAALSYADFYWFPFFNNKEEARDFIRPNYHEDDLDDSECSCCGFTPSLEILRTIVHQHFNQEIHISKRIYIPTVAQLLNNIYGIKEEPQTLIDCGLLKKEDFKGVNLKSAHMSHLFSYGAIFHLIHTESVNLKALSNVPERSVQKGILRALMDMPGGYGLGELKNLSNTLNKYINREKSQDIFDEKKEIIINMMQSNLFVNVARDLDYGTPLHQAVARSRCELVAALLEIGAQASLNIKDDNSRTPLDLAKKMLSLAKKEPNNERDIEECEEIIQMLQNAADQALA